MSYLLLEEKRGNERRARTTALCFFMDMMLSIIIPTEYAEQVHEQKNPSDRIVGICICLCMRRQLVLCQTAFSIYLLILIQTQKLPRLKGALSFFLCINSSKFRSNPTLSHSPLHSTNPPPSLSLHSSHLPSLPLTPTHPSHSHLPPPQLRKKTKNRRHPSNLVFFGKIL